MGQGRKTSTLDANTNYLDPSIILASRGQKRYSRNWHFGVSLQETAMSRKVKKRTRIEIAHSMSHTTSSPALGHPAAHQCRSFSIGIPSFWSSPAFALLIASNLPKPLRGLRLCYVRLWLLLCEANCRSRVDLQIRTFALGIRHPAATVSRRCLHWHCTLAQALCLRAYRP